MARKEELLSALEKYNQLRISEQLDYSKFHLYSVITHSTAIEGSTVTEIENALLFDHGQTTNRRSLQEQLMNLDLKNAYLKSQSLAEKHVRFSIPLLCELAAEVMKNTGSQYNTLHGSFDSAKGELRRINVSAGLGGKSYLGFKKIEDRLKRWCDEVNQTKERLASSQDIYEKYKLSFLAHFDLLSIHPWADGNGRTARLIMNHLQYELGLVPSKVLKEEKAQYIQALIDAREAHNPQIIVDYLMESHIRELNKEIADYQRSENQKTNSLA